MWLPFHISFHPSLPNEALGVVLAVGEREEQRGDEVVTSLGNS